MNSYEQKIFTLHRYYISCNKMRWHFDELNKNKDSKPSDNTEYFLYVSYWYAGLYVVIEGWKELNLKDEKIDTLLNSKYKDRLRLYRNGIFHYQSDYYSKKTYDFIAEYKESVPWVRELHKEFGRYFLAFFQSLEHKYGDER